MKKLVVWDNLFNMQKMLKRWWFWVGVIVLILVAFYLAGYLQWYAEGAKYRIQNQISNQYIASQEAQQAALEAQYKNDPYGGATPEETLKLFIEALEKKDYTLASNYFVPEKRRENLEKMPQGVESGGLQNFVRAYRTGQIKKTSIPSDKSYEFDMFLPGDSVPYSATLVKNPFNNRWLISEL